ncbi:MAG: centrosomin N-terminal motif 1-containing protein [Promethearchaeota archaeon]
MEEKDTTIREYERIIDELRNENENLRNRIVKLEEENNNLRTIQEPIKEVATPKVQYELKTPMMENEVTVSTTIFSQDTQTLEMSKGPIVEGFSRRECPICGNTNKALIHEIIDRTHIISAYPRMYGKKYKCGQCGREWRIPMEM